MARPLTAAEILATFRKWGVPYSEVDGWKSRDNGSHWSDKKSVTGVMYHHTASDGSDAANRRLITNGRSDLSGPLANFGARDDGVIDIIASGSANHAGKGDPQSLAAVQKETVPLTSELKPDQSSASSTSIAGNSRFYGWESYYGIGNDKTPNPLQHRATVLSMAAIIDKLDEVDSSSWSGRACIGHREWTRAKIDPSAVKMYEVRVLINQIRKAGPAAAKVWYKTGKFPVTTPPTTPPEVPVSEQKPVWKGTAQQQSDNQSWWNSDVVRSPSDSSPTSGNRYWSMGSWYSYLGEWARETVIVVRAIAADVKTIKADVAAIKAAVVKPPAE